jgi:hypothetical protein
VDSVTGDAESDQNYHRCPARPSVLVKVAEEGGHQAHSLVYLGMQGWKDPDVLRRVAERDYTLVTNNAADFRRLYADLDLHAELIIVVPDMTPSQQQALLQQS